MTELHSLMDNYWSFLKDQSSIEKISGTDYFAINTPFLDRHNDYIQIYAIPRNGGWLLTDSGYTLDDLEISGVTINTPKKKEIFQQILNGFGINSEKNEIFALVNSENFAQKKHDLVQTILSVNDMFFLSRVQIKNLFIEDVIKWFDDNDIRYIHNLKLTGKSHYDHRFEIIISKSKKAPERIIRLINDPQKDIIQSAIFAYEDVKNSNRIFKPYVIVNGQETAQNQASANNAADYFLAGNKNIGLMEYRITQVPFVEIAQFKDEFAA
ncbi:MAG: DUF1828 domain-containing protein [Candidatus Pacebacteria bacterium]|nr:DUF1828 domain-containing protein [Candidatus Paceibacterota bacterium]